MSSPIPDEEDVFYHAISLPPEEIVQYLESVYGNQHEQMARIRKLLRAHTSGNSFLNTPPVLRPEEPDHGIGDQIGAYRLIEKLGEGGCGVVYLAEQSTPVKRRVALKVIKLGMDTKEVIARFELERQALAMMDHPNIARVFDAGATDKGRPYFVMELVSGKRITEFCDHLQLSVGQRLELFIQVCHAIQHAHQKGIIHRDIKPSNILVTLYGGAPVPKVIDFGVAKATQAALVDSPLHTAIEQFIGTPTYMSPEQAAYQLGDIDTRADVYSLGVLLYELLTGCTPIDTQELLTNGHAEARRRLIEEELRTPTTRLRGLTDEARETVARHRSTPGTALVKELKGDLDWIVMRSLEKDRRRRYDTASALAAEISRHLHSEPIEARPPSPFYVWSKFARRHRVWFLSGSAVACILILATALSTWSAIRTRRAEKWARNSADTSQAVVDFLSKDLLSQSAPEQEADREIKLRTVLDRAANRIAGRFAHQPLTEAQLRETLASAYLSLGEYAKAEAHLNEAKALRTRQLGADDPSTLRVDSKLATALREESKYAPAESLILATIEKQKHQLGDEHEDTLSSYTVLAEVYDSQGKYPQAEEIDTRVLAIQKRKLGPDHPDTLNTAANLGVKYLARGKLVEAESIDLDTLDRVRRVFGPEHPNTLTIWGNLAEVYLYQNKFDETESVERALLPIVQRVFGPEHPETIQALHLLMLALKMKGQYEDAIRYGEQCLELSRKVYGPEHRMHITIVVDIGGVYRMAQKYPEAEAMLTRALDWEKKVMGPDHPNTMTAMSNLAGLYSDEHQWSAAQALVEQALAGDRRIFGPDHPNTLKDLSGLGYLLAAQNKFAEAAEIFRTSLELHRKTAPNDWDTFYTEARLGEALVDLKKYSEAEPLLIEGYRGMQDRIEKIPAASRRLIPKAASYLQRLYTETNRADKAAEWSKM